MKNWIDNKLKLIIIIFILWVIILTIVVFMHINSGFNYWICNEHGSLAEWVSGIGTILAIVAGFYQISKQNKLSRATNVERHRPRLKCNFLNETDAKNTVILTPDEIEQKCMDDILLSSIKYRKILIRNISANSVYNLAIKLLFTEGDSDKIKEEIFNYDGMRPFERIIVIPKNGDKEIKYTFKKVVIRFVSSANEIGYCVYDSKFDKKNQIKFINARYYYLRGLNDNIQAEEGGKMISKEDLNESTFKFDESKMFNNGIVNHNYSAYDSKKITDK